jgi:hypothetical protein
LCKKNQGVHGVGGGYTHRKNRGNTHKAFSLNPVEGFAKIEEICKQIFTHIAQILGFTTKNIALEVKHKSKSAKFIFCISVKYFSGIFAKNTVDALISLILSKAKSRFA